MKRRGLVMVAAMVLTAVPLSASHARPGTKPPRPPVSASKPVKAVAVKPVKPAAKAPKPLKVTATKPPKPSKPTKLAKATKPVKPVEPAKTTTLATNDARPLTKVQQKLESNTNLAGKLRGRLPEGTDLMTAAYGFKNLGHFVAAVNVSNNLDVPFAKLKRLMVKDGYSLGQSIQQLKPASAGAVEAHRAESDAQRMIAATESDRTPTTASVGKSKVKVRKVVGAQQ